jgi:hypothetical protein
MPRGRPRKPPQFVLLDANAHEALTEIRVGAPPKEVQAKYNLTDQVMDYLATQAPEEKIKIRRARPAQQPLVVLPPPLPQQEQPKPKESRFSFSRFVIGLFFLAGGVAIGVIETVLEYEYSTTFGQLLGLFGPIIAGLQILMPAALRMLWADKLRWEFGFILLVFLGTWTFSTFNQISYSARNTGNVRAESAAVEKQQQILNDQLSNFQGRLRGLPDNWHYDQERRYLDGRITEVRNKLDALPKITTKDMGSQRASDASFGWVRPEQFIALRDLFYGVLPSFGCLFVAAGVGLMAAAFRKR